LVHQQGRRFIVLEYQYGWRDVICRKTLYCGVTTRQESQQCNLGNEGRDAWGKCEGKREDRSDESQKTNKTLTDKHDKQNS